MSGTSLDGVDAALVDVRPRRSTYDVEMLNFVTVAFQPQLLERLHRLLPPNAGSAASCAHMHHALGQAFASAAAEAARDTKIDYVASHGQTVWHDGNAHVTLQLGDAFVIRERLRATVCYDFRSADCAAGGHGAPLVPYADALLLRSTNEDRVAVNVGGIANLTVLPRGEGLADVGAFDSGPGNMLLDAFVRLRSRGSLPYDRNGELALRGSVDSAVLDALLQDPYFALPPPKTTGREQFGEQFLRAHERTLGNLSIENGAATLVALTCGTVADAVRRNASAGARIIVSGGGARNPAIVRGLRERLGAFTVETSDSLGLHADAKEAIAFAILGYETLRGRAANLPSATGAAHAALLGAVAPYDLRALLEKVQAECRD